MVLTAVANARKDAESQLGTLDRALRMRVERRMKEDPANNGKAAEARVAELEKALDLLIQSADDAAFAHNTGSMDDALDRARAALSATPKFGLDNS